MVNDYEVRRGELEIRVHVGTHRLGDEPVHEGFLSPDVRLLEFHAYKRVCHTCCEMGMSNDFAPCTEHASNPPCARLPGGTSA